MWIFDLLVLTFLIIIILSLVVIVKSHSRKLYSDGISTISSYAREYGPFYESPPTTRRTNEELSTEEELAVAKEYIAALSEEMKQSTKLLAKINLLFEIKNKSARNANFAAAMALIIALLTFFLKVIEVSLKWYSLSRVE